jgi:hypothetical protein
VSVILIGPSEPWDDEVPTTATSVPCPEQDMPCQKCGNPHRGRSSAYDGYTCGSCHAFESHMDAHGRLVALRKFVDDLRVLAAQQDAAGITQRGPIDWANLKKAPSGPYAVSQPDGWTNQWAQGVARIQDTEKAYPVGDMIKRRWDEHYLGAKYYALMPSDPPAPSVDPLDVKIDGVTLRRLLEMDENHRREHIVGAIIGPAQRDAISAYWSAQLRAKVAATKKADAERERNRVTYCEEDD